MNPINAKFLIRKSPFLRMLSILNWDHLKIYILALIIRIPLLMLFGEYWDIYVFEKIARDWFYLGLTPYDVVELDYPWIYLPFYPYAENWYAYLPAFFLIVVFFYYIYLKLFSSESIFFSLLFIKIPVALGDLLLAHSITLYLKEQKNLKSDTRITKAVLFNPFLIYTSDIWGMFDSLVIAFIIYSLVFLERKNFKAFGLFYGFSLLLKQTSALIFPFLIIYVFRKYGIKKLMISLISMILLVALITIPFLLRSFEGFIYQVFYLHLSREPQGFSIPALATNILRFYIPNLLSYFLYVLNMKEISSLVSHYNDYSLFITNGIVALVSLLQLMIYSILLLFCIFGKKIKKSIVLIEIILITYLTFIIFNKVSNEQYFLYPLMFLLMSSNLSNREKDFHEFNKALNYLLMGSFIFSLRVFLFIPYQILKIFINNLDSYYKLLTPFGIMTPVDVFINLIYAVLIIIVLFKTYKIWRRYFNSVLAELDKVLNKSIQRKLTVYCLTKSIKEKIKIKKIKVIIIAFISIISLILANIPHQKVEPTYKSTNKIVAFYYRWYVNPSHNLNTKGGDWAYASLTPIEGFYDTNKKYLEMDLKTIKSIGGTTIIFFQDILNRQGIFRYTLIADTTKKLNMTFAVGLDILEIYNNYFQLFKSHLGSLMDTMIERILPFLAKTSYVRLNNTKLIYLTNLEKVVELDTEFKFIERFIKFLIRLENIERDLAYVFIVEGDQDSVTKLFNIIKDLKDLILSYIPDKYNNSNEYVEKTKVFLNICNNHNATYIPAIAAKFLGSKTKTLEVYEGIITEVLNQFSSNHIIIFAWNNYKDAMVIEPTIEVGTSLVEATKILLRFHS